MLKIQIRFVKTISLLGQKCRFNNRKKGINKKQRKLPVKTELNYLPN